MIKQLNTQAKKGNVKAATLLMAYAYGKPKIQVEHSGKDGEAIPITIVEVAAPKGKTS